MDLFGLRRRLAPPEPVRANNVILDGEIVGRLREAADGIFEVAEVTVPGHAPSGTVVFGGRLRTADPDAGYDELARRWARLGYTPLLRAAHHSRASGNPSPVRSYVDPRFRGGDSAGGESRHSRASGNPSDDDVQQLVAQPGVVKPRPSNPWINALLFVVTGASVIFIGALNAGVDPLNDPVSILDGLPFGLTLLAILGAHEFGHYFAARRHRVAVTLPYFIPMPLSFVGTFGAFIQLRSPVRNRNHLFDVGVAGPLAGLVVALPLLVYGLSISPVKPLPAEGGYMMEGNSLLYLGVKYLIHGQLLPANGLDVILDPIAFAAWFGVLVTAFNLLPVGQLDGGHVMFALFGERTRSVGMVFIGILVVMGVTLWDGWLVWAVLTFLLGVAHPPPLNDLTPLDPRRKLLGFVVLLIFVLVFVPVPLRVVM